MKISKKVTARAKSIPVGLAIGGLISLAITLLGSAVVTYLVSTEKIGEGSIGYGAIIILVLGASVGAWGAISMIKRLRLQVCLMSGGVYYLTLLAMTALFFGGQYSGMGVTALAILSGCMLVAFLSTGNNGNWRKNKMRFR